MRVNRLSLLPVLIAALVFLAMGCNSNGVHRAIRDNLPVATPESYPRVLADYQPWFGEPKHINVGYSTQDPAVLRSQIEQAKNMGIYGFAVDWYGTRDAFVDRSYALLQKIASEDRKSTRLNSSHANISYAVF